MKKKIILAVFFVASLVCLFALCASATTRVFVDEESGEEIFRVVISSGDYPITEYSGGGFDKYDADGDALAWYYLKSTEISSGTFQYTVKSEKTKDLLTDEDGVLKSSEIKNYDKLVAITFGEDLQINEFASRLFHKTSGQHYFMFVNIPDSVTKLGDNCFRNCISLLEIGISENSKLTDLGAASFFGCTSLRGVYIPKGVTTLKTEYTNEKYWENGLFRNCQKLENVIFAEDSQLEVIEKGAFNYCYSLKTITLPNSVKTVHPRAFAHCSELEYVNFGAGLERIVRDYAGGDEYVSLFQYTNKLKTVVLPASLKAENLTDDLHTTFLVKGITIYYSGTQEEFIKLQEKFAKANIGSGNPGITNATYNYISPCEAFYNGEHNIKNLTTYSSYDTEGEKFEGCINEGCRNNTITVAPALITVKGESVSEYEFNGITIGFIVNNDAIKDYENTMGVDIQYGVFAVLKERLMENDVFDSEANASSGVIAAEFSSHKFFSFSLKITGFNEDQKDVKIAIGAFVREISDEEIKHAYFQRTKPADGEKYSFISYNDVKPKQ